MDTQNKACSNCIGGVMIEKKKDGKAAYGQTKEECLKFLNKNA